MHRSPSVATVLLIEHHTLVRQMLARYLRDECGLTVVGEHADAAAGLAGIRTHQPRLVLIEWALPGLIPQRWMETVLRRRNAPRIIVVTSVEEPVAAGTAASLGVSAFVLKRSGPETLRAAIDAVLEERTYFCPLATALLARHCHEVDAPPEIPLSPREMEVLAAMVRGAGAKEIAARLGSATKTVYNQLAAIRRKLGIQDTAGLVRYGLHHGLGADD